MREKNSGSKSFGKQFFSGIAILAISTVIVKVIGLLYKIPMMAYLGAEGMGYFNSAYDIYSLFFVIATAGIPVAISILISENKTQGRHKNIKKIFNISLIILSIIGIIGTALLALFHDQFAKIIKNDAASYCILAISPTILLVCLSSAIRGYFQGNQIMAPTAISQVIEALGKLLLGLGFAIIAINKGYAVPMVAAFAVLGLTLGVALSLLFLVFYKIIYKQKTTITPISPKVDKSSAIVKSLFDIAIPITLSSTILSLSKVIDMTMILSRLNAIGYTQEQANSIYGSYSTMAVSIYNLPATLISAIALPLVPLLTSAVESKDIEKEKSVISLSFKTTALISFPAGIGIAVFSKPILQLLFASQASEIEYTAPLLSSLGLSVFLSGMITITNAILQAYKQVKKPIISMVIGVAVKMISSFVLIGIPSINIYGAPISTFFSLLAMVTINLYFIIKRAKKVNTVFNLFGRSFIASILSIAIGIGFYSLINTMYSSKLIILITIFIIIVIYCISVIKLKAIGKNEILMLPHGEHIYNLLTKIHLM